MMENGQNNKHNDALTVLIDLIPDPAIVLDNSGNVVVTNKMIGKVTGVEKEQLIGKSFSNLSFISEEYKQLLAENVKERLAGSNIPPYQIKVTNDDGEVKCLKVNGNSFLNDGEAFDLVVFHDVTEENKIQNELRLGILESEEKFQSITNSVKEALIVVDEEARITYWNPAAEKIFGYTSKEAIGKDIHGLVVPNSMCPEGKERIALSVKTFAQTGIGYFTVGNVELIGRRKDGSEFPAELSISPTKLKGKWNAVGVVKNITERKLLQNKLSDYSQKLEELVQKRTEQLKKAQAELVKSERLAAIGELAGMVGHDLRNPLTGIKNSAYFMKKKGDEISQTQAREMLETIDKCVDYSNKIVNDLLDYSKEVRLDLQEESLRKLLAESLRLIDLPEKIEVQNRLDDVPKIRVDVDKIKRVFINLIKNAIDAMPNGGKITVESKQVDGRLEVSFSDMGAGIEDDILPKLFLPLFTTKAQGMGFGLAICKRIIEAHGGTITVKSEQNRGTTFTVTLPIEPKFEIGGENIWLNIPESL